LNGKLSTVILLTVFWNYKLHFENSERKCNEVISDDSVQISSRRKRNVW